MNGSNVVVEAWMAQKLRLPMSWDAGVTTREDRREKIRARIIELGCENEFAGRTSKRGAETWAQLFMRVYRQSVTTENLADAV